MESFNELLHKIRDAHERELEGWQVRVQELSNKKGCDIKRMEELFSRNQQMKEQQRVLTDNIKTLENRLRAGLCDRCTVTQEVAKRRQHEYESSQIQSLHQFSILVGEMNNLKKDNRRLREELANHRTALDSQITTPEVKACRSPELSPSAAPVSVTATTGSNTSKLPEGGNVAVKMEADQQFDGARNSHVQFGASSRRPFESYKPLDIQLTSLVLPPRVPEEGRSSGEHRLQGSDVPGSPTSNPSQHLKLFKNQLVARSSSSSSSSAAIGEISGSRHVLHAPMPCRPRPIKSGALSFPWSVSERPDWPAAAPSPGEPLKSNPFLSTNPGPAGQQSRPCVPGGQPRQEVRVSAWTTQDQAASEAREPSRLFRVRSLSELGDSQAIALERKEMASIQWRNPGTGRAHRAEGGAPGEPEGSDRPLDLSERGRSRSNGSADSEQSVSSQGAEGEEKGLESTSNTSPPPTSPGLTLASAPSSPAQDLQKSSDHSNMDEEQAQSEVKNKGKADQTIKKDVPVVSISLQPVVLLGMLKPALQKQGPSFSNGKLKQVDPSSSAEQRDGEGLSPASKRSISSTDQLSSRESDSEDPRSQKRIKIQMGFQD